MECARGKSHARGCRWSHGLTTSGECGACKRVTNNNSEQSVAWTIQTVVHPCWTICLVDNPQVGKASIHGNLYVKDICIKGNNSYSVYFFTTVRYWLQLNPITVQAPGQSVKGAVSRELRRVLLYINRKLFSRAIVAHHKIVILLKGHLITNKRI